MPRGAYNRAWLKSTMSSGKSHASGAISSNYAELDRSHQRDHGNKAPANFYRLAQDVAEILISLILSPSSILKRHAGVNRYELAKTHDIKIPCAYPFFNARKRGSVQNTLPFLTKVHP
jgi:hypothetical protein